MAPAASGAPFERFAQHWLYGSLAWYGGDALVYSSNTTGQYNLWHQRVGPHGERGYARALTMYRDRAVRAIVPCPSRRSVFFTADENGDEQYQIYEVPIDVGDPRAITSDRSVRHELAPDAISPDGRRFLFTDNGRTRSDFDLVVRDLRRGTSRRPLRTGVLWESPRWDPSGRRFSVDQVLGNTRRRSFVHDLSRGTTVEVLPHETEAIVAAQGWTPDGRGLLVLSNIDREFLRLERVDLYRKSSKVLLELPHELEGAELSERSGRVLAVVNEDGYSRIYAGGVNGGFRQIPRAPVGCTLPGFAGRNLHLDARGVRVAAVWHTGTRPAEVVVVSIPTGRVSTLTESMPGGVPGGPLQPPRLVHFRSFDGREIPAFYYGPRRRSPGRAPAVLSIHGGPESQERPAWLYSGLYAHLTARGIHVLAPNIRGSSGYGKTYQRLIHHDWGGNELKDLKAAAEWLCARPEVDRERLGVFGGSFGGFATLSCVSRLPEYWKVGVDVFGPSNLVTFVKSVPPFWTRFMDEWVGNPLTEAKFLRDRSPISYIDQVQADMLIIQGANDPRVNKAESDQMVEELRARGRTVEYLVFPDEGHGFTRTENLLRALGASARFLTDHLVGPNDREAP